MENKKICVICGKTFSGFGNNPYPVKTEGECCDMCNLNVVIFERMKSLSKQKRSSK